MPSPRDSSSGYEWAETSTPSDPEPIALPDRAALGPVPLTTPPEPDAPRAPAEPTFDPAALGRRDPDEVPRELPEGPYGAPVFGWDDEDDADRDSAESARRARRSRRALLVGIVALQASALLIVGSLAVRGALDLVGPEDGAGTAADPGVAPTGPTAPRSSPATTTGPSQPEDPGTVTDAQQREVTDGTGRYESPARVGEHTFSWPTWTDGTLSVTALEVDLEATLPAAADEDVVQDGYRLVSVAYEARYEGPGQFAPIEELWLTAETDRTYYQDVAVGLVEDPMRAAPKLRDGETARFTSLFIVAEDELDSFRLGAQTYDGELLYYGVG